MNTQLNFKSIAKKTLMAHACYLSLANQGVKKRKNHKELKKLKCTRGVCVK